MAINCPILFILRLDVLHKKAYPFSVIRTFFRNFAAVLVVYVWEK